MKYLILALTFLFGSHMAQANTIYLDNGFIAQTDDADKWGVQGSGNSFYTGLNVPGAGNGSYTNPVVTVSNINGPFSFNSLTAYSFYPFDPVKIAIYHTSGLVEHVTLVDRLYAGYHSPDYNPDGSWFEGNNLSKSYTDITHITLVSDFILGFEATLPTTIAAVPEPETYAMLGCGLLMLGALRRKKAAVTAA